jgi:deoxyribose-phosphate aldolase
MDPLEPLTIYDIARMIDVSAVRADSDDKRIGDVVASAKKHNCYLVTVLPSQTERTRLLLKNCLVPKLGGNVGFPSGGQTLNTKIAETIDLTKMGVDEIDMVIDIAAHLSGRYNDVYQEISEVVFAADGKPVKVILECFYLNETQIRIGCDLAIKAGAAFVKTGTGWTATGATLENISLIKNHVGEAIQIKASGGIRSVEMLIEMYRRGARRFGISLPSMQLIFESISERPSTTNMFPEETQL